jgi:putative Mg2+ transporter-C (MgtC) family protein
MGALGPMDLTLSIVLKLVMASVLGGLVGLERELRGKPAGLRTNMFICAGSALFTVISIEMARRLGGDPTRIASQLIPGIGFIGAGSIIRGQVGVQGLTTAATIFVLASVGMAVGGGFYWTAIFSAVMIVLALSLFGWLERRFEWKTETRVYQLTAANLDKLLEAVMPELERRRLTPEHFACSESEGRATVRFEIDTSFEKHQELFVEFAKAKIGCSIIEPASRGLD